MNGAVVEKYLWKDTTTLLAVYDGNDNLVMRFNYGDDRLPVSMTHNGSTYYLLVDPIGSLRAVTDTSGNIVKRIDYDSFGNIIVDTNASLSVPFGFAGGLHDRTTGLVRFGARDYDPTIGRWTAKDPIDFAGGDTNLYGYVMNDPVNWVDPEGLYDVDVHFGWTYIWAAAAGFSTNDALTIATANQGVDEGLSNPYFWPIGSTALHFMSRKEAEYAVEQAIQQGNLRLFGRALHFFQDSYSHEGYRAYPSCEFKNGKLRGKFGHLQDGHDPDKYVESSRRDTEMRNQTKEYFRRFLQ